MGAQKLQYGIHETQIRIQISGSLRGKKCQMSTESKSSHTLDESLKTLNYMINNFGDTICYMRIFHRALDG